MSIEMARSTLKQIKSTSEHASITGSMKHGAIPLMKAFNAIFKLAVTQQWIPDVGIVTELSHEDIGEGVKSMDYIGCSAALLLGMLNAKE
jgi:hypothetical protein